MAPKFHPQTGKVSQNPGRQPRILAHINLSLKQKTEHVIIRHKTHYQKQNKYKATFTKKPK